MTDAPHILLVNPWIYDFAAYDVWAKPYGLLSLAAILRVHGVRVSYIDCLDRFHPRAPQTDLHARHGRGPYIKTAVPHPRGLSDINRTYSRYGIKPQWFQDALWDLDRPDLVLVTSIMTYWYPGVIETIRCIKTVFADTPVVLGGIYARLWPDHAGAHSGADQIASDDGRSLFSIIKRYTGVNVAPQFQWQDLDAHPYPAFDLQHKINYIPLLTGRGCPFDCAYCAAKFLEPDMHRRTPSHVVDEIVFWHQQFGVRDFAFYDDALLIQASQHALPILEGIIRRAPDLHFHTPNALHIRAITMEVAQLLFKAGFKTLRLGLETTAIEARDSLDSKVAPDEFVRAVGHLKQAGFGADQIGAYLLVGLPDQDLGAVHNSIRLVRQTGITPVLAHYTPIPRTRLWEAACAASRYDLASDPIYSNNAIMPCSREPFSWEALSRLKKSIHR